MPRRAPHPCNKPGCAALTETRYCPAHTQAERQRYDRERGSSAKRGYGPRWQKARVVFLADNPFCVIKRDGRACGRPANTVDHIVPHKGDQDLFWDETNWQAACKTCHDRKTALEDGRWAPRG